MADEHKRFRVIDGDDAARRHQRGRYRQLLCRTCKEDTGVATSEFIETVVSPFEENGIVETQDATHKPICVHCLARGKVT